MWREHLLLFFLPSAVVLPGGTYKVNPYLLGKIPCGFQLQVSEVLEPGFFCAKPDRGSELRNL